MVPRILYLCRKRAASRKSHQLTEQKEPQKHKCSALFSSYFFSRYDHNVSHVILGCSSPGCQSFVCKRCGRLGTRVAPRYLRGSGDGGLCHQNNFQKRNQLHDSLQWGGHQEGHHGGEECLLWCLQCYGALWYVSPHSQSLFCVQYVLLRDEKQQWNAQEQKVQVGIQSVTDLGQCAGIACPLFDKKRPNVQWYEKYRYCMTSYRRTI